MKITRNKITSLVVAGMLFSCINVMAQDEDCSERLKTAENQYEQGNLENVAASLSHCLESDGFSDAEKVEAYKLLTMIGLFEDNFKQAELNMTNLLKTDPDFVPKQNDPIELKDLYKQFRTDPLYTIGVKVGLNSGYTTLLDNGYHSVFNSTNPTQYINSNGFHAAAEFNLRLGNRLMWNFEPSYSSIGFINNEYYNNDGSAPVFEELEYADVVSDQKTNYKEKQTCLGLVTGLKVDLSKKKQAVPYILVNGGYYSFLGVSTVVERDYFDLSGSSSADKRTVTLNSKPSATVPTPERTEGYFLLSYAFGYKYKIGRGNIVIEAKHNIGLNNVTNFRHNNQLRHEYYYLLDDITMNSFMLSIGYLQSIYKPKILKRKLEK